MGVSTNVYVVKQHEIDKKINTNTLLQTRESKRTVW